MKLLIVISNIENDPSKKRMYISDDNYVDIDYSIEDIVSYIKKENPHQLVVSVKDFFTGDNLKLLLEAVKDSNIQSLILTKTHPWFEKEEDFSHFLEINVLDKLLYSDNPVALDFMVKTEERVSKILENEEISKVLKSKMTPFQSFSKSCSAYSIMNVLYKDTPDFNMYTELSIYSQIWEKPGEIANPLKIRDFLKKENYQVDLVITPALSDFYCKQNAALQSKLTFFKKNFDKNIHEDGINDKNFKDDRALLLINSYGSHIISAKRLGGKVELFDSYSSRKKIYSNVDEFITSECGVSPTINTGYIGASLLLSKSK